MPTDLARRQTFGHRFNATRYGPIIHSASYQHHHEHTNNRIHMEHQQIIIPALTTSSFPVWVAAIRLQASALGITKLIDDLAPQQDHLVVLTLASMTNPVLGSITADVQSETIQRQP